MDDRIPIPFTYQITYHVPYTYYNGISILLSHIRYIHNIQIKSNVQKQRKYKASLLFRGVRHYLPMTDVIIWKQSVLVHILYIYSLYVCMVWDRYTYTIHKNIQDIISWIICWQVANRIFSKGEKKILKKLPEFGNQIGVSKTLLIISGLQTLGRCVYTYDDGYIQYMNFFYGNVRKWIVLYK